MLVLEFGQVVDILVDDDPKIVGLGMRLDIGGGKGSRHDEDGEEREMLMES